MTVALPHSTFSAPPLAEERWDALARAAAAVALVGSQAAPAPCPGWSELTGEAAPWRIERAELELADLAAVMRAGLAALLALKGRGADPSRAAQALLEEFAEARAALLALLDPVA